MPSRAPAAPTKKQQRFGFNSPHKLLSEHVAIQRSNGETLYVHFLQTQDYRYVKVFTRQTHGGLRHDCTIRLGELEEVGSALLEIAESLRNESIRTGQPVANGAPPPDEKPRWERERPAPSGIQAHEIRDRSLAPPWEDGPQPTPPPAPAPVPVQVPTPRPAPPVVKVVTVTKLARPKPAAPGMKIRTAETLKPDYTLPLGTPGKNNRVPDTPGVLKNVLISGSDVWWVLHDDGLEAPYHRSELISDSEIPITTSSA